ncbi:S-layer homology domain-containing protein [Paenibacillus wulumuqiensis]|uniref:S-layer homology domain-containing protein n=1 Tax=Paenibacillus wulumuqiensis TaxID=1567107 RepID=UPI0006982012|nr:S-layer homology domain-containing protein [Paenibacillus wulumuqiensis]
MNSYIKKGLCIALTAGLSWSLCSSLAEAKITAFKDVPSQYWGYTAIQWGVQEQIIQGYPDQTFHPAGKVNKQEYLTMLLRAYQPSDLDTTKESGGWAAPYLDYASKLGWKGVPSSASGKEVLTRGQAAIYMTNAVGKNYSETDSIRYLLDQNLVTGKTSATVKGFHRNDPVTRAEAVTMIQRMHQKITKLEASPAAEQAYTSSQKEDNTGTGTGKTVKYTNSDYHFSVNLPDSWSGQYEAVPVKRNRTLAVDFVDKQAKEWGGVVFTVSIWPAKQWKDQQKEVEEQVPVQKLGEYKDQVYLLFKPTDVQYDPSDSEQTKQYNQMSNQVAGIGKTFQIVK